MGEQHWSYHCGIPNWICQGPHSWNNEENLNWSDQGNMSWSDQGVFPSNVYPWSPQNLEYQQEDLEEEEPNFVEIVLKKMEEIHLDIRSSTQRTEMILEDHARWLDSNEATMENIEMQLGYLAYELHRRLQDEELHFGAQEENEDNCEEIELKEGPKLVVSPIQLDSEDLLIFNEIAYQVECCYVDNSIFEMPYEGEPPRSHHSSKCFGVLSNDMSESFEEDTLLKQVPTEFLEVGKEDDEEVEWYKVEFEEENSATLIFGVFNPTPTKFHNTRFFTLVEILFFWYRDGYSDACTYLEEGATK